VALLVVTSQTTLILAFGVAHVQTQSTKGHGPVFRGIVDQGCVIPYNQKEGIYMKKVASRPLYSDLMVFAGLVFVSMLVSVALLVSPATGQEGQKDKAPMGTLKIAVQGFSNDKGQAIIGLCNSKTSYLKDGKEYKKVTAPIKNKVAEYTFIDIPFGEYAIKTCHDENSNGKLDTNFMGAPDEKYGISNNVRGTIGLPDWKNAKFDLNRTNMSITIKVE
jgi:uncharacterized protein (DUF2141 family)